MEGSVLGIADMTKPFKVEIDAPDFALGGILLQHGQFIAHESRKLSEAERRYSALQNEMLAMVHCLRAWRQTSSGPNFWPRQTTTPYATSLTYPRRVGKNV